MIRKITTFFILAAVLTACQNKSYYQNAVVIKPSGWQLTQKISFHDSLNSQIPDSVHFEINIRHTNLYPYQNIWLYIQTNCSDGLSRTDSIDWKLSEPSGRWVGTGWGSLYSLTYPLPDLVIRKTNNKNRWFTIEIQHGLRDRSLKGVTDIGVRLH